MGFELILETTFLIDLERELLRGAAGPAQRLLERLSRQPLHLTFTIAGELAAGVLTFRPLSLGRVDLTVPTSSPVRMTWRGDTERPTAIFDSRTYSSAATTCGSRRRRWPSDMPLVTRNVEAKLSPRAWARSRRLHDTDAAAGIEIGRSSPAGAAKIAASIQQRAVRLRAHSRGVRDPLAPRRGRHG